MNVEMSRNKQVKIPFSIRAYEGEVLCDVVPMQTVTYYWEDLGNLIGKLTMINAKINIPLRRMEGKFLSIHLPHKKSTMNKRGYNQRWRNSIQVRKRIDGEIQKNRKKKRGKIKGKRKFQI
jgi:hypothetical protein